MLYIHHIFPIKEKGVNPLTEENRPLNFPTTKIVIAEDEFLVRVGLKSVIPWEKYHLELMSEFSNGDELDNVQ